MSQGGGGACECPRAYADPGFCRGGKAPSPGSAPDYCAAVNYLATQIHICEGFGGGGPRPPCPPPWIRAWRVGVFFNFPEGGWRHADNVQGGCACECPRVGVFFNFPEGGWRHADNVQGGGACGMSSPPPPPPPPPFRKSCIRACYLCKISGKSTPLPPPPNQSVPIRLCLWYFLASIILHSLTLETDGKRAQEDRRRNLTRMRKRTRNVFCNHHGNIRRMFAITTKGYYYDCVKWNNIWNRYCVENVHMYCGCTFFM